MEKRVIWNYDSRNKMSESSTACVYNLNDGSILKIFNPNFILQMRGTIYDVEKKILDAKPILNSPEILVPTSAAYRLDGSFMGYTMKMARGTNCIQHDSRLTVSQREDLHMYAKDHARIEAILQRNPNIVFPDVCTLSNLFFDDTGNISLIDYEGLQVDKHGAVSISSALGDPKQYPFNPKYCRNGYYTKELDKKSAIILYFSRTFQISLNTVGQVLPYTNRGVTLDDVFNFIQLDDPDLCPQGWKAVCSDQPKDFLGDTVYKIADKYDMHVTGHIGDYYTKVLTKKR